MKFYGDHSIKLTMFLHSLDGFVICLPVRHGRHAKCRATSIFIILMVVLIDIRLQVRLVGVAAVATAI